MTAGILLLGCNSVDRFDTKGASAYCGKLVGGPGAPFHAGLLPEGMRPKQLGLTLKLDATALASRGDTPTLVGRISSDDSAWGLCAEQTLPLFLSAPLRSVPELDHDPLSLLEFGNGRDYNFFAWVDSTCQGTMLAVVSLMRNDNVELRLLKPAAQPVASSPPALQPGFGLFFLDRRDDGCPE